MRRSTWVALAALAATTVAACSDENPTEVTPTNPSLAISATGPCNDLNIVSTITDAVLTGDDPIIDVARIRVIGIDPGSASGDLSPGTRAVFDYVLPADEEAQLTAGYGGFVSTRAEEVYPDAPTSGPIEFVGATASAQFYCTLPGTVLIRATVVDYTPAAGGSPRTLSSREFPVRCMEPARYEATCAGLIEEDMGAPGDGGASDMGPETDAGDGGMPDGSPNVVPGPISIRFIPPADPTAMIIGIRGSGLGRPDTVLLSFRVTRNDEPVPNKRVSFDLPPNVLPSVQIDPDETFTDQDGIARVLFRAGDTPGVASVRAETTSDDGEVTVADRSGPITIRGGVPSARNMHLTCVDPILPAFTSRTSRDEWLMFSGLTVNTICNLQLGDRINGRVDPGIAAFFLSESGTVTQAGPADPEGVIELEYRVGPPVPYDTQPLAYEISAGYADGYNPRDGVVRLVAFTRGEEDFNDVDGNKVYTPGIDTILPRQDLGEPFVDVNDNGRYDANLGEGVPEEFRDTDGDGAYSLPDLEWNGDTEIWTSTTVLWVGNVVFPPPGDPRYPIVNHCLGANNCSLQRIRQDCPNGVFHFDAGGRLVVDALFADRNGNCPDGYGEGESFVEVEGGLEVSPGDGVRTYAGGCFVFFDDDGELDLEDDPVSGTEVPRVGLGTLENPLRPRHRYVVSGPLSVNLEGPPTLDEFVVGVRYRSGNDNFEASRAFNVCY